MSSPRTMKQPPGGDCHDLFGAEFKGSPCHHRVLKPPGGGTSDIFGRPEAVEQSPRRSRPVNHLQSSLFTAETNGTTAEPPSTPRNKPDSNPVTGEAYTNGEKETSSPPAPATTNGSDSAQARRGRVPPGGFSSGLW